jgi:hypothetical protein
MKTMNAPAKGNPEFDAKWAKIPTHIRDSYQNYRFWLASDGKITGCHQNPTISTKLVKL